LSLSFSSLLAAIVSDLLGCHDHDLSGLSLVSLVLTAFCNPLDHSLHVDHHLPFPPSWL
jgi:hypothetical protein